MLSPAAGALLPYSNPFFEGLEVQITKAWRDRVGDCLAHGVRR